MPTTLPTPPAVPNRLEGPVIFNAKAGPWADWQVAFAAAVAALGQEMTDLSSQAALSAAAALAAGAAGISTSSTSLALGLGTKNLTVQPGKAYAPGIPVTIARTSAAAASQMRGTVASYNSSTGAFSAEISGFTGTGTFTDWTVSVGIFDTASSAAYEPRTTNVALGQSDSGKLIDITAAIGTQAFGTPGELGYRWRCRVRNSSTGDVQVASDGVTYFMCPGEVRDFVCDGTTLRSVVIKSFYRVWTTSGNFTCPPGYDGRVLADLIAGGGSGGGGTTGGGTTCGGAGGGGGGRVIGPVTGLGPGTVYPVTGGAGGASVAGAANGIAGGNTTFAGLMASGGAGGLSNSSGVVTAAGQGSVASGTGAASMTNQANPVPASIGGSAGLGPAGGGTGAYYGGGISSAGGTSGAYTPGGGGAAGSNTTAPYAGGAGAAMQGGGGGGCNGGTGGSGGVGGLPGGGGGGGGAAVNSGGASGAGGRGEVRLGGVL